MSEIHSSSQENKFLKTIKKRKNSSMKVVPRMPLNTGSDFKCTCPGSEKCPGIGTARDKEVSYRHSTFHMFLQLLEKVVK